jgi:UPF0271 protein
VKQVALNCDLGESFGIYALADESQIIPLVDQANIACGFHGGDPTAILKSLSLCKQHSVSVGAHPSYPDLQGFGRRSMVLQPEELDALLIYQIGALIGAASTLDLAIEYVKPHGALYNDMMKNPSILETVLGALAKFPGSLKLMILATPEYEAHQRIASKYGIDLIYEGFADRRYTDSGALTPRSNPDAVLDKIEAVAQAHQFILGNSAFPVDSICVHGDSPAALHMVKEIRALIRD